MVSALTEPAPTSTPAGVVATVALPMVSVVATFHW